MYKHAICAPRTTRGAGFPAVANHQQMCVVCHPRRQLRFEYCVRPFGRCARREQVQSCCDPMDMGVDWHRVATQVEHQDAGRRLRPDPVEGHQPVACLLDLHCAEERQIVAAGAVTDLRSARPPLRIASATSLTGASITASQSGKRCFSDRNERSVLISDVFCDRIVAIRPSIGGSGSPRSGVP